MVVFSLKVIHDFNEVSQNLVRPISAYTLPVAVFLYVYCRRVLVRRVCSSQAHTIDALQVSFHFLQCIFQHVHLARGQSQPGSMVSTSALFWLPLQSHIMDTQSGA